MRKQYSLLGGDVLRFHPVFLVFLIALILSFFMTGIIKIISTIVFMSILIYILIWVYQEIWGE